MKFKDLQGSSTCPLFKYFQGCVGTLDPDPLEVVDLKFSWCPLLILIMIKLYHNLLLAASKRLINGYKIRVHVY